MDVALSGWGRWLLRGFFGLVVLFLYAPIAILLLFSFNKSVLPTFPLSGFTLDWYHQFFTTRSCTARSRRPRSSRRSRASARLRSVCSRRWRCGAGSPGGRRSRRCF